ncbi:zinc ribbon domain-containing protein [Paraburkholderia sp. UYCP14C]|uniref:zinc ribbon domain-containing protein n=1 Tax=Paraburkholderia sp. UYCP14C TaxID=2511130 RepID=UPI00101FE9B3|nr:zinc ribbon domain-containing protein [Paraburkholderia sp. UYCP14C]RZF23908.1 zinc ribbon domain-containing protein [Paraburkholderia sp. UYCP14C]
MALIKYKEFGSEPRGKPTKCVKYRAPGVRQQTGAGKTRGGVAILIVGSLISGCCVSTYGVNDGHDPMNQAQSCCTDDLQCQAEKAIVAADTYCKVPIERLATHEVRWTAAPNEMKFSYFRWTDQPGGTITYVGDKAEFRNDVGIYTPIIYQCSLASDGQTVLDVSASAGRLPP